MTGSPDALGPGVRCGLAGGMVAAHVALAWALLQLEPVRQAVGAVAPIFVDLVNAEAPEAPPPPPPSPKVIETPRPRPVVAAAPAPLPEPPAFVAPAPPLEPPMPEPAAMEAPVASAPPPMPPAPPPEPKTIAATAVDYLSPPVLTYPRLSQRRGEEGRVLVRVLVDAHGQPQQMAVAQSSGFARLDEAALATVRATRFKPYTENGAALPFWVLMPLVFELRN